MSVKNFRAYNTTTEWSGPPRAAMVEAEADADEHNEGCASQGGYGSAIACRRDPEAPNRLEAYNGDGTWYSVWPPHGRSNGAARWVEVAS